MTSFTNLQYRMRKEFRYFHEPIPEELSQSWVMGRLAHAKELADRIMLSRGGAFLVSGLRGVGKTTCVRYAIQLIRADSSRFARLCGTSEVLDVWLNLARPLSPPQLLHHLIRHLYLRLKETGLLLKLHPSLRQDLHTAFLRTSFEISSSSLTSEEQSRSTEIGFGKARWLGIEFMSKLSSSYKHTRKEEEALKYLPYDEKAAEFEILSFSRRLMGALPPSDSRLARTLRRLLRRTSSAVNVKVIFVLDELDKLESSRTSDTGKSALDPVLQTLKSVFTGSGFSFVFIAGKEIEDRLVEDASRGDSIYESIFAYDLYLPCLWIEQTNILERCLESDVSNDHTLSLYFRYRGRGVPRRVWREVNKHVFWQDETPSLHVASGRHRYMEVFAKAQEALEADAVFVGYPNDNPAQTDRRRLCFYYTIDWVFNRASEPFTIAQVSIQIATLNLGIADAAAPTRVAYDVLHLLLQRAFVERADEGVTRLDAGRSETTYRLSPWVLLAFSLGSEKQSTGTSYRGVDGGPKTHETIGRYRVLQHIGEGGFADIYKVVDNEDKAFAAKVLRLELSARSQNITDLFEREVDTIKAMRHQSIVQVHDSGREKGCPYVILDLIEGVTLRHVLDSAKHVAFDFVCTVGVALADVFAYVHSRGLVRLDIKPSNIILTPDGEIKVVDFGIALSADSAIEPRRKDEAVIGTPGYIAPEQFENGLIDQRGDIFSLGTVLWEMMSGQKPLQSEPVLAAAHRNADKSSSVTPTDVPAELLLVIQKALSRDPADRFGTMTEFSKSLSHWAATDLPTVIRYLTSITREGVARTNTRTVPDAREAPKESSQTHEVDSLPPVALSSRSKPVSVPESWLGDEQVITADRKSAFALPRPNERVGTLRTSEIIPSASRDSMPNLIQLLRDPNEAIQQAAFRRILELESSEPRALHLVFDLARQICLWSGVDGRILTIQINSAAITLGRNMAAVQLPINDPYASRQQLAFFVRGDSVEVEDLSTASGTLRNGKPIRRERLDDGDHLSVGDSSILVHILPSRPLLAPKAQE